jgi:hypothetical protein
MYVVRRPFRNNGNVMLPGSCVEPDSIKRFKTRLNDRYIVEVTAHNFDQWNAYFVGKFGVAIEKPHAVSVEDTHAEAPEEIHEVAPNASPVKATVKVVVKATH